jgi:NADH-quinone oxidoreductase subunit E
MSHYLFELALWVLLIFLIGCFIGWFLKRMFAGNGKPYAAPVSEPVRPVEPVRPAPPPSPPAPRPPEAIVPEPEQPRAPEPVAVAEPVPEPVAAMPLAQPVRMERPRGLDSARGGKPDNLQRISGIGPKNEKILHNLGFFHFDQIASWTPQQVSWVDDHLKFNGRIGREEWIEQSRLLASGADDEFNTRYGPKRNRPA